MGPSCNATFDLISSSEHGVPDSAFTASSESSYDRRASSSRIDAAYSWIADPGHPPHWIKVDLGQDRVVKGIRTTSNTDGGLVFTRQYTISASRDDVNWTTIQENADNVVFEGNSDENRYAIVTNLLPAPITTRFVRLNVVTWNNYLPGLRWAVDGCPVETAGEQ